MKRVIVDFSKLSEELKTLFVNSYPDGYRAEDIISFKNMKGETVEAIELKTIDAVYLVKVNKRLAPEIEAFTDEAFELIIPEDKDVKELTVDDEDNISFDEQEIDYNEDDEDDDFFSDSEED